MSTFEAKELEAIACRILRAAGASERNAHEVAAHLVDANLTGHDSHGVIRIPSYIEAIKKGEILPEATPEVVQQTATTARVDGHKTFGPVAGNFATEVAVEKARTHQVAAVSMCNHGHVGRLGTYPERCARAGLASIMYCSDGGMFRLQAPFGGREPRFSTNPISMGCPSDMGGPILLDFATAVVAEGKLRVYRARGEKLPDTWVTDSSGRPSNDPNAFYNGGALMPLGGSMGHKGYALAYMAELFGSILPGMAYAGKPGAPDSRGAFIIVFDPAAFLPPDDLMARTRKMTQFVKSSPVTEGNVHGKILYPGKNEAMLRKQRQTSGISIEDATWDAITGTMRQLNVNL